MLPFLGRRRYLNGRYYDQHCAFRLREVLHTLPDTISVDTGSGSNEGNGNRAEEHVVCWRVY